MPRLPSVTTSVLLLSTLASLGAQSRPFGRACKGAASNPPVLSAVGVPLVGSKLSVRLDAGVANAPCMLIIGASNTTWGGIGLPFDLASIGHRGCFLEVSADLTVPVTANGQGRVSLALTMPPAPADVRAYLQGAVLSGGTTLGTSNGLEITTLASRKPFSIIALPDTQVYTTSTALMSTFHAQTAWVVNNRVNRNIAFLTHVGDVTQNGGTGSSRNQIEWDRAHAAMARLDGVIPYAVSVGNHDLDVINRKPAATQWVKHFGPTRYTGRNWFGGASRNSQNLYQIFDAGGLRFLSIVLEWYPSDTAIAWAQDVMTANPSLPTILTTHQYLGYGKTPGLDSQGATPNSGGDNDGYGVRHKLVEPFPQVFMVFCGHYSGGSHRETSTVLGQRVVEVLSNFQFDPNGGNGWLNPIEFRPDRAEMQCTCISPVYVKGTTPGTDHSATANNNFIKTFDFHLHRRRLTANSVLHFTEGRDHGRGAGAYRGTVDTFLATATPTTPHGSDLDLRVDTNSASSAEQGLLRFDEIFGKGVGQIPKNRRIASAILTLTTEGSSAPSTTGGRFYRLIVPFTEASTWQGMGNGIQIGSETVATHDADTGGQVAGYGTRSFDVTTSLRAWQAGAPNHGWAVLNPGSRKWTFRASEWGTAAERPMLTVVLED